MQLRIKELREQRGMTLAKLGKEVGRQKSTIFYYEDGTINISLGMLENIAKVLDCTVQDLLPAPQPEEPANAIS